MKRNNTSMTLLEMMIAVALFSIVMLAATQSILRGMSAWGVSARDTAANLSLQLGVNNLFMDMLKAKYITSSQNNTGFPQFNTVSIQIPTNYTDTGDGQTVGNFIRYIIRSVNGQAALYREVYQPGGGNPILLTTTLLILGVDTHSITTTVDAPEERGQSMTGFEVIHLPASGTGKNCGDALGSAHIPGSNNLKQFIIYMRLPQDTNTVVVDSSGNPVLRKGKELISKVYVRNLSDPTNPTDANYHN